MRKKLYKIYRLICLITNMDYIGETKNSVLKRISRHIGFDSLIGRAIRKHEMENFKIEVLWQTTSKETADCIEKVAIDFYNTQFPNGYNLTEGGEGTSGFTPSAEWRKKQSEAKKGNQNARGTKHTKEFCMFQSKKMIKRNRENNPSKNPITVLKQQRTKLINRIRRLEK